MTQLRIGILHPGQMGISVAASAKNSGHEVYWASDGRSTETSKRADSHGLKDAGSLGQLCEICSVLISICPPHAAETMATQVMSCSYSGIYIDANAISPKRTVKIARTLEEAGIPYVDGGIVGGPAWQPGTTWLHLSGDRAETAAICFSAGPLETNIIDGSVGKASALKMCFAAYTKGTSALLSGILATADSLGVREALFEQWAIFGPDFAAQTAQRVRGVTAKAWRFSGEMTEIATTFKDEGLPGGFHDAAADIYRRLAHFKDAPELPLLEEVLKALQAK